MRKGKIFLCLLTIALISLNLLVGCVYEPTDEAKTIAITNNLKYN